MLDIRLSRRHRSIALVTGLAAVAACASHDDGGLVIPAESSVVISLAEPVASSDAGPGQDIAAVTQEAITDGDVEIVPTGTPVTVEVVEALPSRDDAPARLTLALRAVRIDERDVPVEATPLELVGRASSDAGTLTTGAVGGAVVGGLANGGRSAITGGVIGTMAGAVVAMNTNGEGIELRAGQLLSFRFEENVAIPTR